MRLAIQPRRCIVAAPVAGLMANLVMGAAGCFFGLSGALAEGAGVAPAASISLFDLATVNQAHSLWAVFAIVLLQQLGLPVLAFPALLVAGSLAESSVQLARLIAVAAAASVCADSVWYAAGRAFGYRILMTLCKLSVKPGSCITSAEDLFTRWGVASLVVAKFVPGFSTFGPPVAGALNLSLRGFLVASAVGAGLWAGAGVMLGWLCRAQVRVAINVLTGHGNAAFVLIAIALVAWLGWLVWRKRRFEQSAAATDAR
jgi:membrane protein DedA with SNARE-associated domain